MQHTYLSKQHDHREHSEALARLAFSHLGNLGRAPVVCFTGHLPIVAFSKCLCFSIMPYSNDERVTLLPWEKNRCNISNEAFDLMILSEPYVSSFPITEYLKEVNRLLKPGGVFLLSASVSRLGTHFRDLLEGVFVANLTFYATELRELTDMQLKEFNVVPDKFTSVPECYKNYNYPIGLLVAVYKKEVK